MDRHSLDIHKQNPRKIMRQRNYYRQPHAPSGVDEFCLEDAISQFYEDNIARWISTLINDPGSFAHEDGNLLQFMHHIEFQHLRVPQQHKRAIEDIKRIAENLHIDMPGLPRGPVKEYFQVNIADSYKFNYMREMLYTGVIRKCLYRMDWNVCSPQQGDFTFITSDNPVTIFNTALEQGSIPSIDQVGATVLYPLTPSWCLHLTHPEMSQEPKPNPLDLVSKIPSRTDHMLIKHRTVPPEVCAVFNLAVARAASRVIAASDPLQLECIRELMKRK